MKHPPCLSIVLWCVNDLFKCFLCEMYFLLVFARGKPFPVVPEILTWSWWLRGWRYMAQPSLDGMGSYGIYHSTTIESHKVYLILFYYPIQSPFFHRITIESPLHLLKQTFCLSCADLPGRSARGNSRAQRGVFVFRSLGGASEPRDPRSSRVAMVLRSVHFRHWVSLVAVSWPPIPHTGRGADQLLPPVARLFARCVQNMSSSISEPCIWHRTQTIRQGAVLAAYLIRQVGVGMSWRAPNAIGPPKKGYRHNCG